MDVIKKLVSGFTKLKKDDEEKISLLSEYLNQKQLKDVRSNLKRKAIKVAVFDVSFFGKVPRLVPNLADYNEIIKKKIFEKFSGIAKKIIPSFIAPELVGSEDAKKAAALQIFSKENFHVLLIGDPGTGKTKILSDTAAFCPLSSFGLGSGTSNVGLSVSVYGDKISEGLLPMANNGLCALDELNLMKKGDYASLYNAMEKGFVTYDKGGKHLKFDANVRILATANPKKDRFAGKNISQLKKELPFDSALLTRFHVIFFFRKPNLEKFVRITKKILESKKEVSERDREFIKAYAKYSLNEINDVKFDNSFEKMIVDFVGMIKKNEMRYLIEVSPRIVIGLKKMAMASARMCLRKNVNEEDIETAINILKSSLESF